MEPARNRKQRRAAAATAATSGTDASSESPSIPLAHPPPREARETRSKKSKSDTKTLYEIIAERQNELDPSTGGSGGKGLETQFMTVDPSTGKISAMDASDILGEKESRVEEIFDDDENGEGEETAQAESSLKEKEVDEEPIPPVIDTLLLSFPLTTLHMTLGFLAAHQYAEEINLDQLLWESAFQVFPLLSLLIHLAHGHIISLGLGVRKTETISLFPMTPDKLSLSFLRKLLFPPALKTVVFLLLAVFLGDKLMTMTNEDPYYAVMKRAPAIGTLWVWSILEIPVGAAALGALGPLGWGIWMKGYGIF